MTIERAIQIAKENGFSYVTSVDVSTIQLLQEVRDMCSSNTCGMYGKNGSCPPACGELEECRARVSQFQQGILVQTVGDVEDSLDFEAMMEIEALHKENFLKTAERLRGECKKMLPLGAGCCTICASCACPEAPCRFPEKRISSLEAYGILVSDLCKKNDMAYYYGPQKMAYTSAILF